MDTLSTYCTYCGKINPETHDHIPPDCLFPSPKPSNLITVPSCSDCNNGASKDDEYFKVNLLLKHDVAGQPGVSKLLDSVFRGFSRVENQGLAKSITRSIRQVPIKTASGLYLGNAASYEVDTRRLGKVASRIIMCLFYKEFNKRLESTHEVSCFAESGINTSNNELRVSLTNYFSLLMTKPSKTIGQNIFEYRFIVSPDDEYTTMWLLRFYNSEHFLCFTVRKNISAA